MKQLMTAKLLATSNDDDFIILAFLIQTQKFVHLYINEKFLDSQLPLEPDPGSDFLGATLAMMLLSASAQVPLAMAAFFQS